MYHDLRHHSPPSAGVPAFSANKVTSALPGNTVRTTISIRVGYRRCTIRPPREEIAVVVTLLVWGDTVLAKLDGSSRDPGKERGSRDDGGEEHRDGSLVLVKSRGLVTKDERLVDDQQEVSKSDADRGLLY